MNNENMTIKIITEEAKEMEANVISIFGIKETGNEYAIYTFNEEDAQGLVKIYASKLGIQDGMYAFEPISDANEWSKIKDVMKDTAKEKSSYIENGDIYLISAKQIKSKMNEPISVKLSETKAAKIGPNYKTGITNNYLNNVQDEEPTSSEEATPQVETPNPEEAQPQVEVPAPEVEEPKVEVENKEPEVTVEPLPHVETPQVDIPTPVTPEIPKEPEITVVPTPTFDMPKVEPEINSEPKKVEVDLPEIPKFEEPKVEESKRDIDYSYDTETEVEKEPINVDSVLNKASYFQNLEEPPKEEKENIIQTIGLEFMRKVSELAEYEKDLKKKNREMEAREKVLSKVEKEIISKENRQKQILQASKDKEMELKKKDRELSEKEADLNRRILEFNKKISMFQQTFETISPVDE